MNLFKAAASRPALAGAVIVGLNFLTFILFAVGNTTVHQLIPRHIQIISFSTLGLGAFLKSNDTSSAASPYGDPSQARDQHNPGDGLREHYTWGFSNQCAGYKTVTDLQYCDSFRFAHPFEPAAAMLRDIPPNYYASLASILTLDFIGLMPDPYFADWTRLSGYAIFAGLFHLVILMPLSALAAINRGPRWVPLGALVVSGITTFCFFISLIIWGLFIGGNVTALNGFIVTKRNNTPLAVKVDYGTGFYMIFMIAAHNAFATVKLFHHFRLTRRGGQSIEPVVSVLERNKKDDDLDV